MAALNEPKSKFALGILTLCISIARLNYLKKILSCYQYFLKRKKTNKNNKLHEKQKYPERSFPNTLISYSYKN